MKVLYVTNMYPIKSDSSYGVFVKEQIEAINNTGKIVHKLYFIKGYKSKFEYLKSIFLINILIVRWRPDIIHVHYGISGLFLLVNPFILKRVIITLHGGDINIEQGNIVQYLLTRIVVKLSSQVIVLNNNMLKNVQNINSCAKLLPCGVNTTFFSCKDNYSNYDVNNYLLVFPGSTDREVKNFPLFERVFIRLQLKFPKKKIMFQAVQDLNRSEVIYLLCKADCMIMTSNSEGSPQIVKEALSCQLPVVSVDVGDVSVILKDVSNCYVTRDRSSKNLEKLVSLIIEQEHVRTNGREILEQLNLDNDKIIDKIFNLYKKMLTEVG